MDIAALTEIITRIQADLRAETIARELAEAGVEADACIIPTNAFKRPYSRDVVNLENDLPDGENSPSVMRISAAREGLADMIPPGLFYRPTAGRDRSEEVMLEDAEMQATGFMEALRFFEPFDMEAGKFRIALEAFEHQSVTNTSAAFADELFRYLWPNMNLELNAFEKSALLSLAFRAGHIAGDLLQCGVEIEKIFLIPVKIIKMNTLDNNVPGEIMPLGKTFLGVSWAPLGTFADEEHFQIRIGPVSNEVLPCFRHHPPEGRHYKLLKFVCDLLLPVEVSWQIAIVPCDAVFRISKKNELGVLSYSTILG